MPTYTEDDGKGGENRITVKDGKISNDQNVRSYVEASKDGVNLITTVDGNIVADKKVRSYAEEGQNGNPNTVIVVATDSNGVISHADGPTDKKAMERLIANANVRFPKDVQLADSSAIPGAPGSGGAIER